MLSSARTRPKSVILSTALRSPEAMQSVVGGLGPNGTMMIIGKDAQATYDYMMNGKARFRVVLKRT